MEDKNITLPENINYNVYNGLNLMNEELGQSYIDNGFNPLGDNFVLDEEFITDQIENNSIKQEYNSPDFILGGDAVSMEAFNTSSENVGALIELLIAHLNNPDVPEEMKRYFRKMLLYLVSRNELIRLFKKKKKKERNSLLMYQNLTSLNWEFSKPLEKSYKKDFDPRSAMNEYIKIADNHARHHMHRRHREDDLLIAMAQQIIEKNNRELKEQESLQQKQTEATKTNQTAKTADTKQAAKESAEKQQQTNTAKTEITNQYETQTKTKDATTKEIKAQKFERENPYNIKHQQKNSASKASTKKIDDGMSR